MMELSGKIAGVVFYKMNGQLVARAAPRRAKRTKTMKQRTSNFGVAAAVGSVIRQQFVDILPNQGKGWMHSRLAGAISKWMGARKLADIGPEVGILSLQDFQFNDQCSLSQRFKPKAWIEAVNTNALQFSLPDFVPASSILVPPGTESVFLEIRVVSINLNGPQLPAAGHAAATIEIPYNEVNFPARTVELAVPMQPGCLVITACGLRFRVAGSNGVVKNLGFLPVAVVDGRYV